MGKGHNAVSTDTYSYMAFSFSLHGTVFLWVHFWYKFVYSPVWKEASSEIWNLKFYNLLKTECACIWIRVCRERQRRMRSTLQSCCHLGGSFALIIALTALLVSLTYSSGDEIVLLSLGTCRMLDKKCLGLSLNTLSQPDWPPKTFQNALHLLHTQSTHG